ncbi:amino acid deaminase/aldolase [Cytobacillus sp. Hz8]|uniref:amino acid deaminase/aldolase n=1 Tax=Cytobacillus sp. Hz8 TaxID=3347168 RepID=UPI0035DE47E2
MIHKALRDIPLPALLLDIKVFDENCRTIAAKAQGKTIRIATKSIRSVPVLRRILQSSSTFQGLMCFSPKEALFLEEKGFDDILLGYPCWDNDALRQMARRNLSGKQFICMIDSLEHLIYLEQLAKEVDGLFYLCIDGDMSSRFSGFHFGVRRSPIHQEQQLLPLLEKIKETDHLTIVGFMGYEAQIAGVGDNVPGAHIKNKIITFLKNRSLNEIVFRRQNFVETIKNEEFELTLVNGGGTGSILTTSTEEVVTEITVGSGFYSPLLFDYYSDFQYKPSLFFALPIVRKPTATIFTCLGGGYIASGPPGQDKVPQPIYPMGGKLLPLEAAGEVQTPVYYENQPSLEIGDAIIFRAAKAGEICERFNEIICFSDGQIVQSYPTYRGEGGCFL